MMVPANQKGKRLLFMIFAIYCIVMLWLLFGQRLGADVPGSYWDRVRDNINLIPFHTIREFIHTVTHTQNPYLVRHGIINLAGNIIMFVPLGFFPPCIWERMRSFGRFLCWAAACIIVIELCQMVTLLGSCDIDDLILNIIGVAVGYGICSLIFPRKKKTTS